MYYRRAASITRVSQGDIFTDVETTYDVKPVAPESEEMELINITYTHAIILTQECDLEQDFKNRGEPQKGHDKFIPCILLAPAYLAETLKEGKHLTAVELSMQKLGGNMWASIKKNQVLRYHFLPIHLDFNIPELIVDFKHYFTIPRNLFCETIMKDRYAASLAPLFREHLSDRFTHYLSRIGLPGPEPAEKAPQQA